MMETTRNGSNCHPTRSQVRRRKGYRDRGDHDHDDTARTTREVAERDRERAFCLLGDGPVVAREMALLLLVDKGVRL
jgi:hypothetical protein